MKMATEGDDDTILSLQDVVEEDQRLEQTANAVLGDSDDTRCTYPKVIYCTVFYSKKVESIQILIICFVPAITIAVVSMRIYSLK